MTTFQNNFPIARMVILIRNLTVVALVLTCLFPSPAAQAEENPPVNLILFDTSGSMWGKFANSQSAKFLAARDALAKALQSASSNNKLGLVTFGTSCNGANVVIPPSLGTSQSILKRIGNLNPRSKGPISLAIKRAAQTLPPDTPGSILLIHDGIDNCRQDPCTAARELAERHPRLRINLASLAMEKATAKKLQCVAEQTGGRQRLADTFSELELAVAALFSPTLDQPIAQDSPKPSTEINANAPQNNKDDGPPGLSLSAALVPNGPALKTPLLWLVTKEDNGTDENNVVFALEAAKVLRRIPPGKYNVSATIGLVRVRKDVTVKEKGTTRLHLALNAGRISFLSPKDGTSGFVTVKAMEAGNEQRELMSWLGRSTSPPLVTPVGRYQVIYENGLLRRTSIGEVEAGKQTQISVATRSGLLQLQAQTPSGAPVNGTTFHIRIDDPALTGGGKNVMRTRARVPKIRLPAGTYVVTATNQSGQQEERIVVGPNGKIEKSFIFEIGTVTLTTTRTGAAIQSKLPLLYRVYKIVEKKYQEVARSTAPSPSFKLLKGRYLLSVELGSGNVRAFQFIDIVPDETKRAVLVLDAGELTLTDSTAKRGTDASDVFWEVIDAKGKAVWRTNQLQPTTLLAPGRYTVRNEKRTGVVEKVLELGSGAVEVVELGK